MKNRKYKPQFYCWLITILLSFIFIPFLVFAYQPHQVFFQNTDYELHIYRVYGEEPGKTLLIIGGIQGNEPGGYLAADMYVEMALKKGNLIVVPRANFSSILRNVRGVNGDMNRKFGTVNLKDYDGLIIEKLKELIKESDFLLNLHDGSGFYSDTWKSDLRNPKRYGQSIIADCDIFFSKKHNITFSLGEIAQKVCSKINPEIKDRKHLFHFNNHRTSAPDTIHQEQRKSATYFALTQHDIPAFGIETSKNLPSPKLKVRYQTMAINAFMEEFGIVPANPSIALPDPKMKYLIVSINDATPIVVYNEDTFLIEKGDALEIIHAEANYARGITANILKVGSINDMKKVLRVYKETDIIVKKDNLKCGKISIAFKKSAVQRTSSKTGIRYLIIQVNKKRIALCPGEQIKINRGDVIVLKDLITLTSENSNYKVNFKGFVGNKRFNDGEDRGYRINTAKDLMVRFSEKHKGEIYKIIVSEDLKPAAKFIVNITDRDDSMIN